MCKCLQFSVGQTGGAAELCRANERGAEQRQVSHEPTVKPLIHLRPDLQLQNSRPDAGQHLPGQTHGPLWLLRDTETRRT